MDESVHLIFLQILLHYKHDERWQSYPIITSKALMLDVRLTCS